MSRSYADPVHYYRRILVAGFAGMVLLSGIGLALMLAALELQANAQAYIAGESNWSKGVNGAVFHLDRYLETREPAHLEKARAALSIPLGDLRARRALEREPVDLDDARQGFIQGGNAPDAVPAMILTYRYFREAPYIRQAVAAWRGGDPQLLRLASIMERLAARGEPLPAAERAELRSEITRISEKLRAQGRRFTRHIMQGVVMLERLLVPLSALGAGGLAVLAWLVLYRTLAWLRARDRRFRTTFEQAGMGMAQVGLDARILDANPALCASLAMERDQLVGLSVLDLVSPDDAFYLRLRNQELLKGQAYSFTTRRHILRGDGSWMRGKITAALTYSARGEPEQFIWILEDITQAQELAEQLSYQASHDELTGLYNRREMERRIGVALEDARQEGSHHALCFIDVDQFQVVNDSCGHVAGDQLLRRIVAILQPQLRAVDLVGRLGGDEFAVILHYTEVEEAELVAEKLRRALAEEVFYWEDRSFRLTASIGIAEITERVADVTWVLRAADTACHLAKDMGRDRVHAFKESDQAVAEHYTGLRWLGSIRRALDDDRLYLYAQRIEHLGGGADHFEVLVRLMDENGQMHTPGGFLPAAERYGLAAMVDMRVLDKTLAVLARHPDWPAAGGRCHVNVSGASMSNHDFHDFVVRALQRHGVAGERLCFEITETAAMANLNDAWRFFDRVRNDGVSIALDDFGSGMSSFNYLRNLPAAMLKIDGAFVREMVSEKRDYAVVRAINDVADALDKTTVAEFVETGETRRQLRELGVDFAQGFAIHRPEPLEDLLPAPVEGVAEPGPSGP